MNNLSHRERELVAIGAAIGSNCSACIVYHVATAKKLGLSAEQIKEAIELSEKIRNIPANQIIQTAYAQLGINTNDAECKPKGKISSCC